MHILNIVYVEKFPKCLGTLIMFLDCRGFRSCMPRFHTSEFFQEISFRISFRGKTHLILAHIDELLDFLTPSLASSKLVQGLALMSKVYGHTTHSLTHSSSSLSLDRRTHIQKHD
jgi:hypothetical protein